jgi:hypothetical protein
MLLKIVNDEKIKCITLNTNMKQAMKKLFHITCPDLSGGK